MISPTAPPSHITAHILALLSSAAHTPYIGEPVSQLAHSLQCAHLASTASPAVDEETVIAALLHDIGQFVPEGEVRELGLLEDGGGVEDMVASSSPSIEMEESSNVSSGRGSGSQGNGKDRKGGSVGRHSHDVLGAMYLAALTFPPKVCALVGSHVAAKRYLCAINGSYYDKLSDASKRSLEFQGGPMREAERREWEEEHGKWTEEMCRLRRWDDEAKVVGKEVPGCEEYKEIMERVLEGVRMSDGR